MIRSKHGLDGKALAALATVAAFAPAPVALAATDVVVWHAYRGDEKAAFEKVVEHRLPPDPDGMEGYCGHRTT